MVRGLEDVVYAGEFVPVFCAAGAREIGIIALLNDIIDLIPSPLDGPKRMAQGKDGEEELKPHDDAPWRHMYGKRQPIRLLAGYPISVYCLELSRPIRMFGIKIKVQMSVCLVYTSSAGRNRSLQRLFMRVILRLFPN